MAGVLFPPGALRAFFTLMEEVSAGGDRVVYDIPSKPPATIGSESMMYPTKVKLTPCQNSGIILTWCQFYFEENRMPRKSETRVNARKEEIIHACAALYETMSFKNITLKEISEYTSLSRPSIYNYFQTKEEIFLALLQQEYELWIADLDELASSHDSMSTKNLAAALAGSLERRERLLKIMSMNHYDMEENSRIERLVEFKAVYGAAIRTVERVIAKFRPTMSEKDRQSFLYMFFPFIYGIYPYTEVSENQRQAMEKAKVGFSYHSIYEIACPFIQKLLEAFA